MLRDAVRGVVVVATELAEEASRRVLGAAEGLIQRTGELPPGVEQLRVLAEETVTAGRAGVDLVAGVVKSEAERVFEKVGDQVVKVGVVLSFLESKLREVEEPAVPEPEEKPEEPTVRPAARAQGLFGAGWDAEPAPADEASDGAAGQPTNTAPATPAPRKATARKGAAAKQAAAKRSVPRKAPTEGGAAVTPKTVAKKAAAKKTAAKKTAVKKTVTKKATADSPSAPLPAAANKAAANKAAVKKAAAKKAAPAKKTATEKKAAPGKATTAKKAPARKPAAKPEPGSTDDE
ncbi:hypothetical protein ACFYS8_06925 [Kitasatospora sp. NPDC004615]|uniref:hypothetical protein n=1 Tax=Kitasatospora sp. NPDC004615 TaxID=3364017 RepID=UPI0036B0AA9D